MNTYAIIGDVHSCYKELDKLLAQISITRNRDEIPPELVFCGDLFDRGPDTVELVSWVLRNEPRCVRGNHDDKLLRFLKGSKIKVSPGLQVTLDGLCTYYDCKQEQLPAAATELRDYIDSMPMVLRLDENTFVSHGALTPDASEKFDKVFDKKYQDYIRSICLFGITTGNKTPEGYPERLSDAPYWDDYPNKKVFHGHIVTPTQEVEFEGIHKNVVMVDTGCVFGGKLSAVLYPEMKVLSVQSRYNYNEQLD